MEASLSVVVGDKKHTHGLLAGFPVALLRPLADHMHRRLSAFQHAQGLMTPLLPLEVVATTEEEMLEVQHTLPMKGYTGFAAALSKAAMLVFTHRGASTAWCVPMFAGLYASGRLLLAAGLNWWYIPGHLVLGGLHAVFLLGAWGAFVPAKGPPTERMGDTG